MSEYHINHVGGVCSPECQPTPDWVNVNRRLLDAVIDERNDLAAKLAAIKALCERAHREGAPYGVDCDEVLALIDDSRFGAR